MRVGGKNVAHTCVISEYGQEAACAGHGVVHAAQHPDGPVRHCRDCKKAKKTRPSGETPQVGCLWCEKKHREMHKQRSRDCFVSAP